MGFDKDSNLPLVNPQKRTTKVNFGIVVGIVIFLLGTAGVVIWYSNNPPHTAPKEQRE